MYNEYFGFRESPFGAAPSALFFYSNDLYREALANLRYGIEQRKGLIVMTGEVGTGKTTVLGKTMRSLEATAHPVFVSYNHLSYFELVRLMAKELGLAFDLQDRLATVEQLRDYLIAQHNKGHVVALLIDEAQSLSDEMFEDIRLLSNLETEEGKLLQIVLAGQPELERRLDEHSLRHIKQRIVVYCRLAPLKDDEVGRYIEDWLQQSGYAGKDLFAASVVRQIASYSGGIPRLINIICDNALLVVYAQSRHKVTTEIIDEVVRDLGLKQQFPARAADSAPAVVSSFDAAASSTLGGAPDRAELVGSTARHKGGLARVPISVSLALVAIAGASGAFFSRQIGDYFQSAHSLEDQPLLKEHGTNRLSSSVPLAKDVASSRVNSEVPRWQAAEIEEVVSQTGEPTSKDQQMAAKQRDPLLGIFQVTAPFSFVRSTPRSNAKIIATLQPGTEVNVVSKYGDYFKVKTTVDGRTIRGYVHREDAFFERVRNDRRQEASKR